MTKEFEIVPHTADLKIRAYGISFEELFKNALKGMFSSIRPKSNYIYYKNEIPIVKKFTVEHSINLRSENREMLLIDFLSECLYLSDINNEAYFDAQFEILNENELQAKIYGVQIDGFEVVEIKAVTYHDLEFESIDGLLTTTIIFDI